MSYAQVKAYKPGIEVSAKSRIEWSCKYDNREEHEIYQGARSTDEMCMFIGAYYPRNDELGFCAGEGRGAFLRAHWNIGRGKSSCRDSFNCVAGASMKLGTTGAASGRGAQMLTSAITECLLDSDPALVEPVSEMIGCLASVPKDGNPLSSCSTEIAVCSEQ